MYYFFPSARTSAARITQGVGIARPLSPENPTQHVQLGHDYGR